MFKSTRTSDYENNNKKLSPPFYHSLDFHNFYKLNDNLFFDVNEKTEERIEVEKGI